MNIINIRVYLYMGLSTYRILWKLGYIYDICTWLLALPYVPLISYKCYPHVRGVADMWEDDLGTFDQVCHRPLTVQSGHVRLIAVTHTMCCQHVGLEQ